MRSAPALVLAGALLLAGCTGGTGDGTGSGDPTTGGTGGTGGALPGTAPEETGPEKSEGPEESGEATTTGAPTDGIPALDVEVVASGLDIPWDVQLLPDGAALVGERGGRLLVVPADGEPQEVGPALDDLFARGEAGLMGLAVSPTFDRDGRIYACYASQGNGGAPRDVRVVRLRLDTAGPSAEVEDVVVEGLPITTGRHSGCRLLLSEDGQVLLVGTGDAADADTSQSLISLGGKVLAVTADGDPLPESPFVVGADPRVLTTGHRNVQGLAVQPGVEDGVPGVGVVWSVEHGPDVDDEVNVIVPGANYGWDPGPGYDEGVPMTDLDAFPDAVEAVWSSGRPTHATSGAAFLKGPQWGDWQGSLAVAELKGSGVSVLRVDGESATGVERMTELDGAHGRLRSLTLAPDGALWVTTSNGDGRDEVLRVTPRSP